MSYQLVYIKLSFRSPQLFNLVVASFQSLTDMLVVSRVCCVNPGVSDSKS